MAHAHHIGINQLKFKNVLFCSLSAGQWFVRLHSVFFFSGSPPPATTKSQYQFDCLKKFSRLIPFSCASANWATKLAVLRIAEVQDRHLPAFPSIPSFFHGLHSFFLIFQIKRPHLFWVLRSRVSFSAFLMPAWLPFYKVGAKDNQISCGCIFKLIRFNVSSFEKCFMRRCWLNLYW